MIAAGWLLVLVGALWELGVYWRGAWPTVLTWVLMAVGLAMIARGVAVRRPGAALAAWSMLGVFLLGLVLLWASG